MCIQACKIFEPGPAKGYAGPASLFPAYFDKHRKINLIGTIVFTNQRGSKFRVRAHPRSKIRRAKFAVARVSRRTAACR